MKIGTGVGTLVTSAQGGFTISAFGKKARFRGAWFCKMARDGAITVALGYVNGVLPAIEGRSMDGLDAQGKADPRGIPTVPIKMELFDKDGKSWVCVQVRVDANGKMIPAKTAKPDDLKIIQSTRLSPDETLGLFPIAMMKLDAKTAIWTLRQIAYFDVQHGTRKPDKGKLQHFFW